MKCDQHGRCQILLLILLLLTGGDATARITTLQPGADIRTILKGSTGGDTILLKNGDYQSPGWLDNIKFIQPVIIIAENVLKARFVSGNGLNINNCRGLHFEGIEITSLQTNAGLVQVQGQSSYITIKNCHIFKAPLDADCIKVNQSNNINVIGCHLHDPGTRAAGNGLQETLDYLDVDTGLISRCFFTGGTSRQYVNAKGLSSNIVVEDCLLLDHNGDQGDAAIVLGGWSSSNIFEGHPDGYECENIVVRNNIIINSKTGVFQVSNVRNGYIYNNLAINCKGYGSARGLIYVSPGNGPGSAKGTVKLDLFNNIFTNDATVNHSAVFMSMSGTTLDSFAHGNNGYYFNGNSIPNGGVFNPNVESGVVLTDPGFRSVSGMAPDTVLNNLIPVKSGSWVNAGNTKAMVVPFPGVLKDILGNSRAGTGIDIGPFEFTVPSTKTGKNNRSLLFTPTKEKRSTFYLDGRKKHNESFSSNIHIVELPGNKNGIAILLK